MTNSSLPFDVSAYDRIPISFFICEPVGTDGGETDFRIVYANGAFLRDWKRMNTDGELIGALLRESSVLDDYSLEMLGKFMSGMPQPFTTYIPVTDLHLHFEPSTDLPKPYIGFFVTNITDFKQLDSKVHFLRNIRQMNGNDALIRRHDDGRFEALYVSESFAKMLECTVDEAMRMIDGKGFLQSTAPEDRHLVEEMIENGISRNGSYELTVRKITKKDNIIWCKVHYAFVNDFGERYIYCTYADITLLKNYETRLQSVYQSLGRNFYQSSESTLAMLRVNLTRDIIEEATGRDLYESDSADVPYSEAVAARAGYLPLAEERERFVQEFDREKLSGDYLQGIINVSRVVYSCRADGRKCFTMFSAALTRHPFSGDMVAFVTERECNSEKVRETLMSRILARQFDMVAYISEGKYGVTIGDTANIRYGNIFPSSRYGIYGEYLERQVFPVLSGDEDYTASAKHALSLEEIEKNTMSGEPYIVNIVIEIDGEIYHKRFDFYAAEPGTKFFIVLKSDTTALHREQEKRNEQLRTALKEAEQANVAKTAFLSSMSHEIRTPMNAIIGIDNIALSEPNLSQQTKDQLEKIGVSARHLLGLINDILDMSRIESGRMVLKNEEFPFGDFLEQINTLVSSQCQDKGLSYECAVNSKIDDYYIGDVMKLKQVIINILGNAVKFTPAPGSVKLIAEQTARFEDKATLRFTIRDTGIGMDKEYLPKIFEAFSQEDATTTNRYGGSGLGMAITKNIVEMMNGNISVISEKGKGTEFTVNVTLRTSDRKAGAQTREIHPEELSVLVIDDDKIAREHARLVLEEIGVAADTAETGKEALEMIGVRHARRESYNLILVDLKMPEQNGIEVTKKIRELYNGESVIVILTAYKWSDVEQEAVKAGVDTFMSKPLFASNVLNAFRQAVEHKSIKEKEKKTAELSGRRILVAEDIMINAQIMKRLLQMKNMEAVHAENGSIAVDMFKNNPPGYFDAILMDMRMPVMDGLLAAQTIRACGREDAADIPIVALTANAFDEDVQRSLQAGMNAHLSKPVEPDRLFETLSELIGERESK